MNDHPFDMTDKDNVSKDPRSSVGNLSTALSIPSLDMRLGANSPANKEDEQLDSFGNHSKEVESQHNYPVSIPPTSPHLTHQLWNEVLNTVKEVKLQTADRSQSPDRSQSSGPRMTDFSSAILAPYGITIHDGSSLFSHSIDTDFPGSKTTKFLHLEDCVTEARKFKELSAVKGPKGWATINLAIMRLLDEKSPSTCGFPIKRIYFDWQIPIDKRQFAFGPPVVGKDPITKPFPEALVGGHDVYAVASDCIGINFGRRLRYHFPVIENDDKSYVLPYLTVRWMDREGELSVALKKTLVGGVWALNQRCRLHQEMVGISLQTKATTAQKEEASDARTTGTEAKSGTGAKPGTEAKSRTAAKPAPAAKPTTGAKSGPDPVGPSKSEAATRISAQYSDDGMPLPPCPMPIVLAAEANREAMRHYLLTIHNVEAFFWVVTPGLQIEQAETSSNSQLEQKESKWVGSDVRLIAWCDLKSASGLGDFVKYINAIHLWAEQVYLKAVKQDFSAIAIS